jgi:hypothetical protein
MGHSLMIDLIKRDYCRKFWAVSTFNDFLPKQRKKSHKVQVMKAGVCIIQFLK